VARDRATEECGEVLVHESGWTPERYQAWLADTLVDALVGRVKAR